MNNISFSPVVAQLIAQFEGWSATPYVDPATHAEPITIGYGSTHYCNGTKVTMKDAPITKEQGLEMLQCYLNNNVLPDLKSHITVELNQQQVDALGCLIYNIGVGGFNSSHVLSDINQGILNGDLETRWNAWNKGSGKVLPGLVTRRAKEYAHFIS